MCWFYWFPYGKSSDIKGFKVVGVDSINNYYDPNLKKARLKELELNSNGRRSFSFIKLDISDMDALTKNLESKDISSIIHLAAQAGVRHSIENPIHIPKVILMVS